MATGVLGHRISSWSRLRKSQTTFSLLPASTDAIAGWQVSSKFLIAWVINTVQRTCDALPQIFPLRAIPLQFSPYFHNHKNPLDIPRSSGKPDFPSAELDVISAGVSTMSYPKSRRFHPISLQRSACLIINDWDQWLALFGKGLLNESSCFKSIKWRRL